MFRNLSLLVLAGCLPIGAGCESFLRRESASDDSGFESKEFAFDAKGESGVSQIDREPVRPVSYQEPLQTPPTATTAFSGRTPVSSLISFASANNSSIVTARLRAESLMARIPQATSFDDPQLTTTVFLNSIQTAAGPQDVIMSLTQKVPWFGKRDVRGSVALHEAQAAFAEMADVELGVVEQIKLAYYELYFVESAIKVYRELDQRLVDVIDSTRSKFETNSKKFGLESVYQAEVARSKLKISVAELEQARAKAVARLRQALHLPPEASLEIEPVIERSTLPETADLLLATIEQCHPELDINRHQIMRNDAAAELARLDYFSDVNLGFSWHAIGPTGLSPVATGDDAYSLMVGVNLPVYKRKRDAAMSEAHSRIAASAHQYESTLDRLRAEVETAYAAASKHRRVLQILNDELLEKSEQTFDLSLEAYRVDRIGYEQLIDAYEDYLRLRIAYHLRTARREQSIARLERAVGCAIAESPAASIAPEPLPIPGTR